MLKDGGANESVLEFAKHAGYCCSLLLFQLTDDQGKVGEKGVKE